MRLLRKARVAISTDNTDFSLTDFFPPKIPPRYAILSHRWGTDEVILKDVKRGSVKTKAGYRKLEFCAQQAALDGIDWFWIDTCCIDKTNNTELSEAINSMFRWYQNAAKCYVYLPDVSLKPDTNNEKTWKQSFQSSAWFTRGWTLQELIAPTIVEFFSIEGEQLGDKRSLEREICQITKIPIEAIQGRSPTTFGVEERLAWAAGRETTRQEDMAYCLLGIFDVYMPLIYGEGRENAIKRLKDSFHNLHAKELECHRSLKVGSYEAHKDRNPLRVPGTCQWVLSHTQFCNWRSDQGGAILWISADPGCGKSVLCRTLVDQVLRHDRQYNICYYFFKDNGEQDNLAPALCAVLHQLFVQQPRLLQHAMPAWRHNGSKLQYEVQELWKILDACAADPNSSPIICIFDGLDECQDTDRRRLIDYLCDLHRSQDRGNSHKLKVLVTSRPYDNVQRWFAQTTAQWPQIRLRGEDENEHIHQEINLVIERQVRDLANEFSLSSNDHQYLRQQLLQMQHRTYLWLHLAMEEIREACQESMFTNKLNIKSLPSSVDNAYERILQKISERQKPFAKRVLLIIVGARRPLHVREMALALGAADASDNDSDTLQATDVVRLEKFVREQCGLFVYIQHFQLFLIHQTAKEFLMAANLDQDRVQLRWKSSLSSEMVEHQMARLCIMYLYLHAKRKCLPYSDGSTDSQNSDNPPQPEILVHERFFEYCAENWTSHLHDHMLKGETGLISQALWLYELDQDPSWFAYGLRAVEPLAYLPGWPVQHKISIFGHATILEALLARNFVDLEELDFSFKTALVRAAEKGYERVSEVLIGWGANVNNNRSYCTPLQAASINGHWRTVELLLDNGSDINAQGGLHSTTALFEASREGHEKVVQVLIDRGADIHIDTLHECGTALQGASEKGHEKVVRALLDAGADINAQRGCFGTALQAAAASGHEKVVKMLLDRGANIAASGVHGTALSTALHKDQHKIVQMLLDKGANAQHPSFLNTSLYKASQIGDEKKVQMLLELGADVNVAMYNDTPLCGASQGGHERVVRMLLDRGANVNTIARKFRQTALQVASQEGHEMIVQMLLDAGADVSAADKVNYTALMVASVAGRDKVVQLLLDRGANAQDSDSLRGTALQIASALGHHKVVQILVNKGANVNAKSRFYSTSTALYDAAAAGREKVIPILLMGGADTTFIGKDGTALQTASKHGHQKVVQILRQHAVTSRLRLNVTEQGVHE